MISNQEDKIPVNKRQSDSAENSSSEIDENLFEYEDNRSSAVAQRKLQENADESPLVRRTSKFQSIADEQFDLSHSIQRKVKILLLMKILIILSSFKRILII